MTWLQQMAVLIPEMYLLTMAIVVLVAGLFLSAQARNLVWVLSMITVIGAIYLVSETVGFSPKEIFAGHFIADPFSQILKVIILGLAALAFWHGNNYLYPKQLYSGEYYSLMLFCVLGMMVLVSSGSLLTIYLGIELLSLPLYALIAIDKESEYAAEASIKYFILGSLASGILLYGISLLFGATGTLALDALASVLQLEAPTEQIVFGLVFVIVGIAFKFGAAPFHAWIPDVYQGAPISVITFLASAPKIAAFGMAYRILIEGLPTLKLYWQPLFLIMGLLSLALGNLVAILQSDVRRMLAYSAIAHVGFMLLGVGVGNVEGQIATLHYGAAYGLMTVGAFGLIAFLSSGKEELYCIDSLRGLGSKRPMMAFSMLCLIFSLAGVPPLLGFYAKLAVLRALINMNHVFIPALAVVFTIIGAFYYLRIVKAMYFEKAIEEIQVLPNTGAGPWLVALHGWAVLFLGIFPSLLFGLCVQAFN